MDVTSLDFIGDNKLREILVRDRNEMLVCLDSGASKSVLVLAGSIIEAILIDILSHNVSNSGNGESFLRKSLKDLIDTAHSENIISSRSKELLTVLRGYRNLIHPGKEVRENERFDIETAKIAVSLVSIVSFDIKAYLVDRFGLSADEIIKKLERDETSAELFQDLVLRLNHRERHKLFFLIRDYRPGRKVLQKMLSDNSNALIYRLKPFLNSEFILQQLKDLVKKVQTSDAREILSAYGIWSDDLHLLAERDREIVILYIINYMYYNIGFGVDHDIRVEKIRHIERISNYVTAGKIFEEFKRLIETIIFLHAEDLELIPFYNRLMSNLSEDIRNEIELFVKTDIPAEYTSPFFEEQERRRIKDDELPF